MTKNNDDMKTIPVLIPRYLLLLMTRDVPKMTQLNPGQ